MYCYHPALFNSESVVNYFSQCSQSVGGAKGIRNDQVWRVLVRSDTNSEHRCIGRRGSDDDLLHSTVMFFWAPSNIVKAPVDVANIRLPPWDTSWVSLLEYLDSMTVNDKSITFGRSALATCKMKPSHRNPLTNIGQTKMYYLYNQVCS